MSATAYRMTAMKKTKARRTTRGKKKRKRAARSEALEFIENMVRLEAQNIPILIGDYAKLH